VLLASSWFFRKKKKELSGCDRMYQEEFVVIGGNNARVRRAISQRSKIVSELPRFTRLIGVEKRGRRLKIVSPVRGWVSIRSEKGYFLLQHSSLDEVCFFG
jgi:hypothetical protein